MHTIRNSSLRTDYNEEKLIVDFGQHLFKNHGFYGKGVEGDQAPLLPANYLFRVFLPYLSILKGWTSLRSVDAVNT